jgi:hypothetical protein
MGYRDKWSCAETMAREGALENPSGANAEKKK